MGFDGLFGDTAVREEKKADIKLRWSNELRVEKGEGLKYRNSFRTHVHLPKFEKKLRLVIMEDTSTDAVAPIPSDPGTPIANTPTQTNSLRAANTELRYYVHETNTGYAFLTENRLGLHRPPGNKLRGAPRIVAGTTDRQRTVAVADTDPGTPLRTGPSLKGAPGRLL